VCRGTLRRIPDGGLDCTRCSAAFPKRAAVDVFLADDEWRSCMAHCEKEKEALASYHRARRESPLNAMYYDRWVARLVAEIPGDSGGTMLELMCGEGEVCRRLPGRFTAALAMDLDVQMVQVAAGDLRQAGEKRVTVVCGNAARIPLADSSVNAVVVQGGFHHAKPILGQILTEVQRVLKPSGVLVGSEPANDHFITRAIRHWQYHRSSMIGKDLEEDGFTKSELAAAMAQADLRLDRYRQFGFVAYPLLGNTDLLPWLAHSRSFNLAKALLGIDWLLEHTPFIRGMAWASIFRAFKEGA